jgi:hypothetical protein
MHSTPQSSYAGVTGRPRFQAILPYIKEDRPLGVSTVVDLPGRAAEYIRVWAKNYESVQL